MKNKQRRQNRTKIAKLENIRKIEVNETAGKR